MAPAITSKQSPQNLNVIVLLDPPEYVGINNPKDDRHPVEDELVP